MSFSMNMMAHSSQSLGSQHSAHSHHSGYNVTGTSSTKTLPFVDALDHLSTKLRIPGTAVELTNAMLDDGLVPGICRLYLEGRCRQGARCFQVHANPDVVAALRQEALEKPSCCFYHGVPCSYEGLPLNLQVNIGKVSVVLPRMGPTNCLWSAYAERGENQLEVPRERVCREHRRGLCRFGEECGFLHICREISLGGEETHSSGSGSTRRGSNTSPCSSASGRRADTNSPGGSPSSHQGSGSRGTNGSKRHSGDRKSADWTSGHYQRHPRRVVDDSNGSFYSFQSKSCPPAANNPHWQPYGDTSHLHYGHGFSYSNSYMGDGMEYHNPYSVYQTHHSFSNQQGEEGTGEVPVFRGPLLRPLGSAPRQNQGNMRHNPYGDGSLGQ
uniref:Uncharacterized protein TCIL3000_7_1440 n=1 Tax=Trypanosoma congolense (strain IL3000) TaxID=1068625 RepID=G0UPM6_TRYCI|nr:unnamed protein product [Trypanosoma congolense IL3000]